MEMNTSGGTASARDSTKVEKAKPKLEPEIARTMRDREAVRVAHCHSLSLSLSSSDAC